MRGFFLRLGVVVWLGLVSARSAEDWAAALAKMPVGTNSFQAHLTPPVELIFDAFKPTAEVRSVLLMPAAADQIYFFNWGRVTLPANPSLLDMLQAFTNQAHLSVRFVAPFLLVCAKDDLLSDPVTVAESSREALAKVKFAGKLRFVDRPYDRVVPVVRRRLKLKLTPDEYSIDSYHFYRLAFVGYDLSGEDVLRAMSYGTKTEVRVEKKRAVFKARHTE